jgi:hypothetical protein
VKGIIFKKFYDGRIFDIADYYMDGNKWVEKIIDHDRYNA